MKGASVPFSGDTNAMNGFNGALALSLNLRNFMTFLIPFWMKTERKWFWATTGHCVHAVRPLSKWKMNKKMNKIAVKALSWWYHFSSTWIIVQPGFNVALFHFKPVNEPSLMYLIVSCVCVWADMLAYDEHLSIHIYGVSVCILHALAIMCFQCLCFIFFHFESTSFE